MVDGIGKGGPPPKPAGGVGGAGGAEKTGAADRPFTVERVDPTKAAEAKAPVDAATGVSAPGGPTPLQRLRAGEIDVNGYIDLKVDAATKSLPVSPADLEEIKKTLRDQMRTDPGLAELVRAATGHMPKPPED
jgi:hypothetical protein